MKDAGLFFRDKTAHFQTGPQHPMKRIIGVHVELLLGFALNVGGGMAIGLVGPEDAGQTGAIDVAVDHLGRGPDVGQEAGEVTCGAGEFHLTRHNEFL